MTNCSTIFVTSAKSMKRILSELKLSCKGLFAALLKIVNALMDW